MTREELVFKIDEICKQHGKEAVIAFATEKQTIKVAIWELYLKESVLISIYAEECVTISEVKKVEIVLESDGEVMKQKLPM